MIEGSYRSWDLYTTGQLVDGLQQKRKPVFIKGKWNHVVFSRTTILSFHPVDYVAGIWFKRVYLQKKLNVISLVHVRNKSSGVFSASFFGQHETVFFH